MYPQVEIEDNPAKMMETDELLTPSDLLNPLRSKKYEHPGYGGTPFRIKVVRVVKTIPGSGRELVLFHAEKEDADEFQINVWID
jgi:hypothetical protein